MSLRKGNQIIAGVVPNSSTFVTKTELFGMIKIGQIIHMACSTTYVPDGCLPCDGSEYNKSQFNELWINYLITGKLNTCTYTEYASDISTYGQCGKFAIDTTNNKFKVPTIKDGAYITQALSNGELGKSYNESLPNISGQVGFAENEGNVIFKDTSGAIYSDGSRGNNMTSSDSYGSANSYLLKINASRSSSTYQDGAKVQGDNVRLRFFIVVANGQVNQSMMDWSNWFSSMNGKLNIDHSNDTKSYLKTTYVNGTSGYRIWSDGYCEQWGAISSTFGNADTHWSVSFIKTFKDTNYIASINVFGGYAASNISNVEIQQVNSMEGYSKSNTSSTKIIKWRVYGYLADGQY